MNHHISVYFGRFALAIVSPSQAVIDHLRQFFAGYECARQADATLHIMTTRNLPRPRDELLSGRWTSFEVHGNRFAIGPRVIEGCITQDQRMFTITVHEDFFLPGLANVINAFFYRLYYTLCDLKKINSCIIHACGVIRDQNGYLFIGPHQSGKTTIGLLSGAPVLHDDQMIITLEGDTLTMDSPPLPARDNLRQRPEAPCELERIFLAVKDEQFSVRLLGPEHALACIYNDVVVPYTLLSADENEARIRKAHLCFALQRAVPVFELHFDRQGRFWEQLSTMKWPASMHEQTTDISGDGPRRFVTRTWLEQYQHSGTGRLTILSGSMAPLIDTGDQIFVRKTPLECIHIGDIITFWKGDVLVTHRAIRTCTREGELCFIERGDAVGQHALCRGHSVLGRVVAVKKGARKIDFETVRWKACNRFIGIVLLSVCAARVYVRKMPRFRRLLGFFMRRAYAVATRLGSRLLR